MDIQSCIRKYLGISGILAILIAGGTSCHSPTNQTMYAAASGKPDQVAPPVAAQGAPGSALTQSQTVVLTSSTPGATVKFTLDGSDPSGGTVYAGNFIVATQNTKLRAIAQKNGFPNSTELTGTYNFANGVLYDPNGGSGTMGITSISVGSSGTLAANAYIRAGYAFTGWNTQADGTGSSFSGGTNYSMTAVGGSVTLYAQWSANAGKIFFYPNDGTSTSAFTSQSLATGLSANLTVNSFSRTGYSFHNWNTAKDGTGTSYTDGQSVTMGATGLTLYAQWTANTYTVSFDIGTAVGGAAPVSVSAPYGTSFTLPSGSSYRKDYCGSFAGWNDGTQTWAGTASYLIPASNTKLTAVWNSLSSTTAFSALNTPRHILMIGTALYVSEGNEGSSTALVSTIKKYNISGSSLTLDPTFTLSGPSFYEAYGMCTDGNYLYVSTADIQSFQTNSIMKIALSTGLVTEFITGLSRPQGVCTDGTYLYISERTGGYVAKVALNSTPPYSLGASDRMISGLNQPIGIAIDTYSSKLYLTQGGNIVAYSTSGTSLGTVLSGLGVEDLSFDLATGHLLFACWGNSTIYESEFTGSSWVCWLLQDNAHGGMINPVHALRNGNIVYITNKTTTNGSGQLMVISAP